MHNLRFLGPRRLKNQRPAKTRRTLPQDLVTAPPHETRLTTEGIRFEMIRFGEVALIVFDVFERLISSRATFLMSDDLKLRFARRVVAFPGSHGAGSRFTKFTFVLWIFIL